MKGVCRSFLLNPESEEITISFFTDKSIISPYTTRTSNGLSNLNPVSAFPVACCGVSEHLWDFFWIEDSSQLAARSFNFQALTEVKMGVMEAARFEEFMVENLEVREFGNSVLRKELRNKVEKEIRMASLTAKERLLKFREEYPLLENLIPHTTISTYLGITNISLSRLRNELVK